MGEVKLLQGKHPTCFVTGEALPIPEARQQATILGHPVMVGIRGKRLLDAFAEDGDITKLPENMPARVFLAQVMEIHTLRELAGALGWLARFKGARLEFMPQHVYAAVFKHDGTEVPAVGGDILEAVGRLRERVEKESKQ